MVQPKLRKSLRTSDGVALLIGITIGSGIYSTPYLIAGYLDSYVAVMTCWVVVGLFVLIGGLIYAELGTRLPTTGGEYAYITTCFGPFAGFMFGWAQLLIIRTSPGAGLAIIASDYIGYFVPHSGWSHTATALGILALVGVFNYIGIRWASRFQKVTTVVKVGGLILFAVLFAVLLRETENHLGARLPPIQDRGFYGNLIPALMLIVFTHTGGVVAPLWLRAKSAYGGGRGMFEHEVSQALPVQAREAEEVPRSQLGGIQRRAAPPGRFDSLV